MKLDLNQAIIDCGYSEYSLKLIEIHAKHQLTATGVFCFNHYAYYRIRETVFSECSSAYKSAVVDSVLTGI